MYVYVYMCVCVFCTRKHLYQCQIHFLTHRHLYIHICICILINVCRCVYIQYICIHIYKRSMSNSPEALCNLHRYKTVAFRCAQWQCDNSNKYVCIYLQLHVQYLQQICATKWGTNMPQCTNYNKRISCWWVNRQHIYMTRSHIYIYIICVYVHTNQYINTPVYLCAHIYTYLFMAGSARRLTKSVHFFFFYYKFHISLTNRYAYTLNRAYGYENMTASISRRM